MMDGEWNNIILTYKILIMKLIILISAMLSVLSSSGQNIQNNILAKERYLNSIKQIASNKIKESNTYMYYFKFGKQEATGTLTNTKKYNLKGYLISEVNYLGDNLKSIKIFTYDTLGNVIKEENTFGDEKSLNLYKYDSRSNLIEHQEYYEGEFELFERMKYDVKDNLIEEVGYNEDGTVRSKTVYKYDEYGRNIEYTMNNGHSTSKITYKFDAEGNVINENSSNSDSRSYSNTYKYDISNNLIEELASDGMGAVYSYNSQNQRIGKQNIKSYIPVGEAQGVSSRYIYDLNGFLIEDILYSTLEEPLRVMKTSYAKY